MGLHKTGTTSIQNWLSTSSELINAIDFAFYEGFYQPNNHIEFGLLSLREHLDAPIKKRFEINRDKLLVETKSRLKSFIISSNKNNIIISNETISFIRYKEEIYRLKSVFPEEVNVIPIIFLRSKGEWLESFRRQMQKMGLKENENKQSCAYFGEDSWLLDHEVLIDLTHQCFGGCRVVEYDGASVRQFASVISPDMKLEIDEPQFNVTPKRNATGFMSRAFAKLKRRPR